MRWNKLIKKLKNAGCIYLRDAKGSHEYWHHPDKQDDPIVIAEHGAKEIGILKYKKVSTYRYEKDCSHRRKNIVDAYNSVAAYKGWKEVDIEAITVQLD